MFEKILYTVVYNGIKYVVNTDDLTDCKLWIKVYDGDNILGNHFMWMLNKNYEVIKDEKLNAWNRAIGFDWSGINWSKDKAFFTEEVKKKLDSYFKLKAFW
jgi:hypothetical protein